MCVGQEQRRPGRGRDGAEQHMEKEAADSLTNSMDMNLSKLWQIVKDRGA